MKYDYSLYLVTDETTPFQQMLNIVEDAIQGGITIVQLREKQSEGKNFYEKALALKSLLQRYDVPLIINDRVDIALAVGAQGIHIGQKDMPLTVVKKIIPKSMIVGVSAQTVQQALAAEAGGADYIGVGAVFPTETKKDAIVSSIEDVRQIVNSVSIPAVAIGGISVNNFTQLQDTGIAGIAVVSAIMKADNPRDAARKFKMNFFHQVEGV